MFEHDLDQRIATGLRAPVCVNAAERRAIMERVRAVPPAERPRKPISLHGRGIRQSIIGLAFAAGIGSITTLSSIAPSSAVRSAGVVTGVVIGDTVVNRLRDTLRLVRLMFDDSAAHHVAVAGDFNNWSDRAVAMNRDEKSRRWTVTLALRDGDHRFTVVADNLRWAARIHVARSID